MCHALGCCEASAWVRVRRAIRHYRAWAIDARSIAIGDDW